MFEKIQKKGFLSIILATLLIVGVSYTKLVLIENSSNFVFDKKNIIIFFFLTLLICLLFSYFLLIESKIENLYNYLIAYAFPLSSCFYFGYPILDEVLLLNFIFIIFIKFFFLKQIKFDYKFIKENFLNLKFLLLITILIYAILGLIIHDNLKAIRYVVLFILLIIYMILFKKSKIKLDQKYVNIGFSIFLISYIISLIIESGNLSEYDYRNSIIATFNNAYGLSEKYKNLKYIFIIGGKGPGDIQFTQASLYLFFVIMMNNYVLSKEKRSHLFVLRSLIPFILVLFFSFLEESRNLILLIHFCFFLFLINSQHNKKSFFLIIIIFYIFSNFLFSFKNIYTQNFPIYNFYLHNIKPQLGFNHETKAEENITVYQDLKKLKYYEYILFLNITEDYNNKLIKIKNHKLLFKNAKTISNFEKKKEVLKKIDIANLKIFLNKKQHVNSNFDRIFTPISVNISYNDIKNHEFADLLISDLIKNNNGIYKRSDGTLVKYNALTTNLAIDQGHIIETPIDNTSRIIHIYVKYYALINFDNKKYKSCLTAKKSKLQIFKEILIGDFSYGFWPKNIEYIDCYYINNDIKNSTRENLKFGKSEPPRPATMSVFLNEYGLLITIFMMFMMFSENNLLRFFYDNKNFINFIPIIAFILLGISTHYQDNIIFWLLFINKKII